MLYLKHLTNKNKKKKNNFLMCFGDVNPIQQNCTKTATVPWILHIQMTHVLQINKETNKLNNYDKTWLKL